MRLPLRHVRSWVVVGVLCVLCVMVGWGGAAGAAVLPHAGTAAVTTHTGTLADGSTFLIERPANWNGTLVLYQHGLVAPSDPNPATDASDPLSAQRLLEQGYALAGTSFGTGWAVEEGIRDQLAVLDRFTGAFGAPVHTVTWGDSMGGLIAAALAERAPHRVDGALSMCGPLAGSVGLWDSYLDVLFVANTLLAPIELIDIKEPFARVGLDLLHDPEPHAVEPE